MQPTFLPWLGYFALMSQVDVFVFLDDFATSRQSWHQRNRLFVAPGTVDWMTVPVRWAENFGAPLNEMPLAEERPWRRKLASRFVQSYAKAPHVRAVAQPVQAWLERPHASLAALNMDIITSLAERLGLTTRLVCSSTLGIPSLHRSERVLAVLRAIGAQRYVAAPGAFDYMREDGLLPVPEVQVVIQRFDHPTYAQVHSPAFVSHLSSLDAIANTGFDETARLLRAGVREPLRWEEMIP